MPILDKLHETSWYRNILTFTEMLCIVSCRVFFSATLLQFVFQMPRLVGKRMLRFTKWKCIIGSIIAHEEEQLVDHKAIWERTMVYSVHPTVQSALPVPVSAVPSHPIPPCHDWKWCAELMLYSIVHTNRKRLQITDNWIEHLSESLNEQKKTRNQLSE